MLIAMTMFRPNLFPGFTYNYSVFEIYDLLFLFFSARELELEDRQGRLQQQLRDSMSLDGMYT